MYRTLFLLASLWALVKSYPNPDSNAAPKNDEFPIATTQLGLYQGSTLLTRLRKPIYSFRGIRYAKAPIHDLRFQPPVPIEKHEGIFNATNDPPVCSQHEPDYEVASEDCLFLNVYSTKLPKGNEKVKRPVIVYIHTGQLYKFGGNSFLSGPYYIMDQDVVLVTFNFRLATLGFLATGEKEAPGNNGLKDQVQVLKWVKQNIEGFGGDPNSVTILGHGGGGLSVVLHMVSPMSAGLFHKAIAMSGSPTSQLTISHEQLELAKRQAKFVNCPDDTAANIIKCLKTKPVVDIALSYSKFHEFGNDPELIWTPVMEKDFGQPRFLTAHPITLIQNGEFHKVPFITGVTGDEFAHKAFWLVNNDALLKQMNDKWEETAPISFLYERKTDNSKTISKTLRKIYLDEKPIDRSNVVKLGELYSDSIVGFGVNRAAKLVSEKNNASTFYYKFNYQGRLSNYYTLDKNETKPYGVVHQDDLIYLFPKSKMFKPFEDNSLKEIEMVNKITILFANFAKFGTPIPTPNDRLDNIKWEPFTTKSQKYLDIGNKLTIQEKLFEKRYSEWEKLFPLDKYAKIKV